MKMKILVLLPIFIFAKLVYSENAWEKKLSTNDSVEIEKSTHQEPEAVTKRKEESSKGNPVASFPIENKISGISFLFPR